MSTQTSSNRSGPAPASETPAPGIGEQERRRILFDWNETAAPYPSDRIVPELFTAAAAKTPDSIAAVHGRRQVTYRDLNRESNQLAWYLKGRGIRPGSIVGIGLRSSPDLAVALLAVMKAGGACMPLDAKYPAERLAFMQQDANVAVVLTEAALLPVFSNAPSDVLCLPAVSERIARENPEDLPPQSKPSDPAYVVYTSGSTGRPRGVLLSHRGLVNHLTAFAEIFGLTGADRVLQFSSISFDVAIEEMFPTWLKGAAVVFRPEGLPIAGAEFLDWLEQERISVLDVPTAYWHEWVNELSETRRPLPKSLRLLAVGGEKASASVFRKWTDLNCGRVRWINGYGPSETTVTSTVYESSGTEQFKELPIGRPIANTRVYVLDASLQPVPVGTTGELYIGGPGVAIGYLNRPDLTAEKFIPDPFGTEPGGRLYKTGDRARYLPDANLEYRGRNDDQVKICGYRIELGEVEAALRRHPGLREAVVVATDDDAAGDRRLLAYFVPAANANPGPAELRDFLKRSLPEYMLPAAFLRLNEIPLSPNGKINRRALPAPSLDQAVSVEAQRSADPVESKLASVWEEILKIRPIGVRDNFFDLGGHSLLAVRLMLRVEKVFGKRLPIMTVFEAPTVEKMAAMLRRQCPVVSNCSLVPMQPGGSRRPFYFVHGMGGAVLRFRRLAHHLGSDRPVYCLQAQGLDGTQPCLTRVEDMAERYVSEILALQPDGPYYLAGYSFGGLVAIEMARRLAARRHQVALLALVDTYPPGGSSRSALLVNFLRLSLSEQARYLARKLHKKIKRTISGAKLPAAVREVRRGCLQAEQQYVPKPFSGRLTLFRSCEKALRNGGDVLGGWGPLALGGVEIQEIPGDHGSIVDEPNVQILARRIIACLEKAQAPSRAHFETAHEH